jgi:hypothetical protein
LFNGVEFAASGLLVVVHTHMLLLSRLEESSIPQNSTEVSL